MATGFQYSEAYSPIAACCSGVNLAYFPLGLLRVGLLTASLLVGSLPVAISASRGPLGFGRPSEGWKYWYITTPLLDHHFHVLEWPIQNLTFLKFARYLFSHLQASCEIYKNLHHSKISRYTVAG